MTDEKDDLPLLQPETANWNVGKHRRSGDKRAWVTMRNTDGESVVVGCFFGLEDDFLRELAAIAATAIREHYEHELAYSEAAELKNINHPAEY